MLINSSSLFMDIMKLLKFKKFFSFISLFTNSFSVDFEVTK